ncbi:DeoR/GlpR family DNA-binding transcription regulator [Aeromonas veronii]|uniref:DeoR/GlpR family DNA-binding transcription regulator n=1 Tax=Aeromonas veronii TaxID=654 RepID=UPI00330CBFE3|nr:DeoR/GlpR transcriptional regulator [Aeromonas veronii]HDO1355911.1 DeoR/GlpR transcriptional regulator [Aeromonas veronii]
MGDKRSERIRNILHYLWKHKKMETRQVVDLFGYSEASIRRDFQIIADGYPGMNRIHGGVVFDESVVEQEYIFDIKQSIQRVAKQDIVAVARNMISVNDCIILDSGSTCLELAKLLSNISAKVITTDVKIANQLGCFNQLESYIVGGMIRPGYFTVGETVAVDMLKLFSADKAFLSCDSLSLESGITNATMFEVGVKKMLIQRASQVILLADHSKFDVIKSHSVATLLSISCIITDSLLPEETLQRYRQAGIHIIRAGE